MNVRGDDIMTARSFRMFATKEDLISIFNDFQHNNEIQYFKCGRMDDLIEISDITKKHILVLI
ncbi:hypothetical protein ACTNC9_02865 [Catenibacterium mitsuokai]|uniref:hypothetical protein n=1 Tax=Catenibacterium mitsuokai TaxID=100886 RepID=UPI003F8B9FB9